MSQVKGATHSNFTRSDDGPDLISMLVVSMSVIYPSIADIEDVFESGDVDAGIWGLIDSADDSKKGSTVF